MKNTSEFSRGLIAMAVTLSLVTTANSAAAQTDGGTDHAEVAIIASAVDVAVPASAPVAAGEVVGDQAVVQANGIEAIVPLSAADVVTVASDDNGGQAASITLPSEFRESVGTFSDDGTVVYEADSGSALAVQTLTDGSTRVQSVIDSATSVHEFEYGVDGYRPYQADSEEVVFVDADGDFVAIAQPWAVDANGVSVPTHYEIRGDKVVQVVQPDESTVYPVVADPTWLWNGPAWGMKLNRSETSRVRDYAAAIGMCGLFAKAIAIKVCGVFASYIVAQANLAQGDSPKSCLFFTAAPIPGVIWRIKC
ncbi:hypothetical protein [Microbacterium sp. GCS4]|uniref:hypothetical protein n=1 Tax=Microbacterium sp. GCS4 TaxID=1692239 RepID=UPI00068061B3|nr:hypothetical protein [Microbacterium sp. GCS4]